MAGVKLRLPKRAAPTQRRTVELASRADFRHQARHFPNRAWHLKFGHLYFGWQHLEESVWRGYAREMVKDIEKETIADHRCNQTAPCGASAVLQKSPHYKPGRQNKSPAPLFHAATQRAWMAMFVGLQEFVVAYREAAERVKLGLALVQFPGDCFPSRLPFVPPD